MIFELADVVLGKLDHSHVFLSSVFYLSSLTFSLSLCLSLSFSLSVSLSLSLSPSFSLFLFLSLSSKKCYSKEHHPQLHVICVST
jgi:hypothetical protein